MSSKRFYIYLVIIVLSFLPFLSVFFSSDLPHTSDGEVQIPRMAAFFKAVKDVHLPVRWAGDLNYGYGMPLFIFIYHTPFYISTVLIGLGVSLVTSFKILLWFSFLLSGIFMFLFSKDFFNDDKKAFFVTLLYQFAPYHLIDILTRGTIGTIYVYSFFPLILYGLKKKNLMITACATALMILAHNSMALIFFTIACLFVLFFFDSSSAKVRSYLYLLSGLGLSAFYWLPAIAEHKYTYGDLFMKDLFKLNFPPFQYFFIPNIFNEASLRISEVAVHWGIFHTIAIIAALILLLRWKSLKKETKKIIIFSFILIIGSVFFMNPLSTPIWERVSFLRQFQFPWRLLSVIVFATSLLGSTLFDLQWMKKPYVFVLSILVIIGATMFYWIPTQGFDKNVKEDFFWNYPLNTTYFGETDVIWSAGPANKYPKDRIEIIEGKATISNFKKSTQQQTFNISAQTKSRIVSHTQYFPGWRVYVDGSKTPIEFQDQNWRGLLTFIVPEGNHSVRIQFEETAIRLIANIISIVSSIVLVGALGVKRHFS